HRDLIPKGPQPRLTTHLGAQLGRELRPQQVQAVREEPRRVAPPQLQHLGALVLRPDVRRIPEKRQRRKHPPQCPMPHSSISLAITDSRLVPTPPREPRLHPPAVLLQRRTALRRDAIARDGHLPPERLLHLDVLRLLQLRRMARQVPPCEPRHALQEPELHPLRLRQNRQDRQPRRLVNHTVQTQERPDLPPPVTAPRPPPPPPIHPPPARAPRAPRRPPPPTPPPQAPPAPPPPAPTPPDPPPHPPHP